MKLIEKETCTYWNGRMIIDYYTFDFLGSADSVMRLLHMLGEHGMEMSDIYVEFEHDHSDLYTPVKCDGMDKLNEFLHRFDPDKVEKVTFSGIVDGVVMNGTITLRSGVLSISKPTKTDNIKEQKHEKSVEQVQKTVEQTENKQNLLNEELIAKMKASHKMGDKYYNYFDRKIVKRTENGLFYCLSQDGEWEVSGPAMSQFFDAAYDIVEINLFDNSGKVVVESTKNVAVVSEDIQPVIVKDSSATVAADAYKWCFYLGMMVTGISFSGIIVIVICSIFKPWLYHTNGQICDGLIGFLFGNHMMWFLIVLVVFCVSGIMLSIFGVIKRVRISRKLQ